VGRLAARPRCRPHPARHAPPRQPLASSVQSPASRLQPHCPLNVPLLCFPRYGTSHRTQSGRHPQPQRSRD
jgi:hypothetical protein